MIQFVFLQVMHGGLFSRDDVTLGEISKIDRNRQPPEEGIISKLSQLFIDLLCCYVSYLQSLQVAIYSFVLNVTNLS
jgi:hypothetical protein